MIKKILIANRGEIAVRIIKTCKKLNIVTVAVYSDLDKNSLFVKNADQAFSLSGITASETYLNIDKILSIAKNNHCDAIHPGYGFLSERAEFAKKANNLGIIFIGPSSDAILAMGMKSTAKKVMTDAGVNILPGYNGDDQSDETLLKAAEQIGFPILIKASAGGGGKGMRIVNKLDDLIKEAQAAKREAIKSFANDHIILEKYLAISRHVEVQILFDQHGNGVYLFERDCSLQRRYQKVIEEAPAPNISTELRSKLGEQALIAGRAVNYTGAGTVEFLLAGEQFFFMEMNTRLQVEHPVTELICELDIVELQIKIADGEKLPFNQTNLKIHGHAIEARLYAEDVDNNFLPATGRIDYLDYGVSVDSNNIRNNIRIDSGIKLGDNISIYYDPMLAKIIAWGESREVARQNLINCISNIYLIDLKTNSKFLLACLSHKAFINKQISTSFINKNIQDLIPNLIPNADSEINFESDGLYSVIAALYLNTYSNKSKINYNKNFTDPWNNLCNYRLNTEYERTYNFGSDRLVILKSEIFLNRSYFPNNTLLASVGKNNYICNNFHVDYLNNACNLEFSCVINNQDSFEITVKIIHLSDKIYIFNKDNSHPYVFSQFGNQNNDLELQKITNYTRNAEITAPMPGTILAITVDVGSKVNQGDAMIILEAMKMEHTVYAPKTGVVKSIYFEQGDQVTSGAELLLIE
ncbi:MAG: ATP-grasp domain-containing protein [Gammaproteobacteria bacterium]|nr:ATP-grasp domain-containing protein [Gammaproteobacteria bacterium]